MEICNKKFFIYDIENKLQNKLYLKYGKKLGKCKQITLPDKIHMYQRINLIKCLIGGYAIKNLLNNTKFYKLPYIDKRVKSLMNYKPKDLNNNSVGDVIKALQDKKIKVFLHGGIIRDMFSGVKSYDIDLIFDADINKIKPICEENNFPCSDIIIKQQYINFGSEKGGSVEGANLGATFLNESFNHEASVNDLVYDLQNNILIDLTGYGISDCVNKIIRLSPRPDEWDKWAELDFKRPFRYFKLMQKGFKPLNNKLHKFIIDYITNNYFSLYNKKINPNYPVKRIKHFLIKTITQGDINTENGTYTFGPTEEKLIPYLNILKKELPILIFNKIINEFTKEDLAKFKNKKVITTINKYLESSKTLNTINKEIKSNHNKLYKINKK